VTIASEERTRTERAKEAYEGWKDRVAAAHEDPGQAKARDEYGRRYALEIREGELLAVEAERDRIKQADALKAELWSLDRARAANREQGHAKVSEAKQLLREADQVDHGPNTIGGRDANTMRERAAVLLEGAESEHKAFVNAMARRDQVAAKLLALGR